MTWLTPWVGAIAAAIAIPSLLILYFLKLRRQDVEISTTLLWKKAIEDLQANAPFQRLRKNLLLLLQLLALIACLFAIAQPQFRGATLKGSRHVILIDRSASMQSMDEPSPSGGPRPISRLESSKRQAIALVESLREANAFQRDAADEAMVIAFDTTAEVLANFTTDKGALRRAIEAIEPSDAPSELDEAMRLAQAHAPTRVATEIDPVTGQVQTTRLEGLTAGEPATMHLWSDGNLPDAARVLPGVENEVRFNAMGRENAPNLAITSIRAERDFENPTRLTVYISIHSTDDRARTADVELLVDGVVGGVKSVTLPAVRSVTVPEASAEAGPTPDRLPPATGGVVFAFTRAEGAIISARIRSVGDDDPAADVLRVDDRAYVIVPPAKRLAVAVVTRGNLFLQTALGGLPLARLVTFTPEAFQQELDRNRARDFDVVVLDAWLPSVAQGETLPAGRWLVFNQVPTGTLGLIDRGESESALFVDWARDHPIMRGLVLDNVVIARSRQVEIPEGAPISVLATSSVGPAIVEMITPEARAIVVPFDLAQSTWPFDVSFIVFMASATTYLGADGSDPSQARMLAPGSILSDRLPIGAENPVLIEPDQRETNLVLTPDGRVAFGPIRKAGLYQVRWEGAGPDPGASRPVRTYASNMTDPQESDVRSRRELTLASTTVSATDTGRNVDRRLWPWLLLVMLGILLFEWYVYNRKVYF